MPDTVNPQITDSVTQANTGTLGDAPSVAMGNLYIATSQALSNAAHNATNSQQQSYVTMQAATVQGIAALYSVDTASAGVATQAILAAGGGVDHLNNMINALTNARDQLLAAQSTDDHGDAQ